jgi:CheY-like chemotaxis protein
MEKIIFIEDDKKKIDHISRFIFDNYPSIKLDIKESYSSGLKALLSETYDLLLLDMSMPTYDKSFDAKGGFHEKFAGHMILKEIMRKKRPLKTILITMFDVFPIDDNFISLSAFSEQLKKEFGEYFIGTVYYNSQDISWKINLLKLISHL